MMRDLEILNSTIMEMHNLDKISQSHYTKDPVFLVDSEESSNHRKNGSLEFSHFGLLAGQPCQWTMRRAANAGRSGIF